MPDSPLQEILDGLGQPQKTLPAKLFYDAEGCRLFELITRLPEYYVTRTELALLHRVAPLLPPLPGSALVEYGGSDEAKALLVIDRIGATAYVPIDIAADALDAMAVRLHATRPGLAVYPLAADFLQPLTLPPVVGDQPKFGFFPGSTIGNLDPTAAVEFLRQACLTLGPAANFLVGVDLRKNAATLIPAYDDAAGVTARFNRNILTHVNRITGADFDPAHFAHRAVWNEALGRVEMHLVSTLRQTVTVAGHRIAFAEGEFIHTENSYKHTLDGFAELARRAGWASQDVWTDDGGMVSLHLLETEPGHLPPAHS